MVNEHTDISYAWDDAVRNWRSNVDQNLWGNCVEEFKSTKTPLRGKSSQNRQWHISITSKPILTLKDTKFAAPKKSDLTFICLIVKFQYTGQKRPASTQMEFFWIWTTKPILLKLGAFGLQCRPLLKHQCLEQINRPLADTNGQKVPTKNWKYYGQKNFRVLQRWTGDVAYGRYETA